MAKYLNRRGAAQDARMDEACELDVGNVARGAENTLKIPNG
jgi:hypothetical protein